MSVLGEEDVAAVKKLDAGIKCSWKWAWFKLKGKVSVKGQEVSFHIRDFFKKDNRQGLARCVLCHKDINYANKGSYALIAHIQTEIHKKKMEAIASTQSVASTFLPASASQSQASQSQPTQGPETIRQQFQGKMPVPVVSRIANAEVLSMLVCYYHADLRKVMVEHLGSLKILRVDAASLEKVLFDFFEKNNIPWHNLVSLLVDSCAVMRGSKTGLEIRIHQHCPNLLDVDSCHHIHNAAKKFSKAFDGYLERLFSDLQVDHQWSPDQVMYLKEDIKSPRLQPTEGLCQSSLALCL
ncbi:uncharacterized protein LOC109616948 isoform X2 [Xyrichtys novacula]|uniref:Uncharacterized protein LOC109616948 isoform X2 n=1 Tax=Xyrichtys novacula TaxID=13765 RepID=A0AAV1GUF6_XYRNO|nr:uncharacterized protein LOC109616948 isoform X2 [Xyrichtys novacula]